MRIQVKRKFYRDIWNNVCGWKRHAPEEAETERFQILALDPGGIGVEHNRVNALSPGLSMVYSNALEWSYPSRNNQHLAGVSSLSSRLFQDRSNQHQSALHVDREDLHLCISDMEGISHHRCDDSVGQHPARFNDSKILPGGPLHDDRRCSLSCKFELLQTPLADRRSKRTLLTSWGIQKFRYLFVMGSLRSFPRARWVIFTPGGLCLRLYSFRSTIRITSLTSPASKPAFAISSTPLSSST